MCLSAVLIRFELVQPASKNHKSIAVGELDGSTAIEQMYYSA